MKVTLPEFERAGVMVVGDVMLDRYWYGPTRPAWWLFGYRRDRSPKFYSK